MVSPLAYFVLLIWPLVVFFLFKRFTLQEALVWSIVVGYLLLPQISWFDLPLLPPYDKQTANSLSAALMCYAVGLAGIRQREMLAKRAPHRAPVPEDGADATNEFVVRRGKILFWGLLALMFGAAWVTTLTNGERLVQGTRVLSALKPYDAFAITLRLLITITPFLLARRFLATSESHVVLLKIVVIGILAYSLLALWELRMSPQLNKQIYGFGPHRWSQHVRGDGYRPIVFMHHGLRLAILFTMASLAAMALWRENLKEHDRVKWLVASIYLLVILFLCKSLGAFVITLLLLPVVFLLGTSVQLYLAAILAGIILVYPMMRGAGLVPTQFIYNAALSIDEKRAHSIQYRFDNEDILLEHANKKPVAGWGTWGRNRVFNEKGVDIAATDGLWVIIVGVYGWLGYIARFGLMSISIILLSLNRKRFSLTPATAGLSIVVAGAMVDLIPNSTSSPITWLLAGALMGRYQTAKVANETVPQAHRRRAAPPPREATGGPVVASKPSAGSRFDRPLHQRRPREG